MTKSIIKYKLFIQTLNKRQFLSEQGISFIEVLVAAVVALLVLSISLAITLSSKRLYDADAERMATIQNLRSTLDIVGIDVREAGERLSSSVPAIEVIDGSSGADVLIVRRHLVESTLALNLCQPSNSPNGLIVADSDPNNTCEFYDADTDNDPNTVWHTPLETWEEHRVAQEGSFNAFIYDYTLETGEFITVTGEFFDGNTLYGLTTANPPLATYPANSGIFIMEERRFELDGNELILNISDGEDLPLVFGLQDMQVSLRIADGTPDGSIVNGFDQANSDQTWADIIWVEVSLVAENNRTLTTRFLPRNVLSDRF